MIKLIKTTREILLDLWKISNQKRKLQLILLIILILFTAISEMISIGAVVPFVGAISNPEYIFNHEYSFYFKNLFNLKKPNEIIFRYYFHNISNRKCYLEFIFLK